MASTGGCCANQSHRYINAIQDNQSHVRSQISLTSRTLLQLLPHPAGTIGCSGKVEQPAQHAQPSKQTAMDERKRPRRTSNFF
jgi:hypothetical protein